MKRYTEKQVVNAIQITVMDKPITYAEVLIKLKPVELPSDEEIRKDWGSGVHLYFVDGFEAGAKWVIEQIKKQNETN